jgi:hypothetical protein
MFPRRNAVIVTREKINAHLAINGDSGRVRRENVRIFKMDVLTVFKFERDRIDKIDGSGHVTQFHDGFLSLSGRRFAARIINS